MQDMRGTGDVDVSQRIHTPIFVIEVQWRCKSSTHISKVASVEVKQGKEQGRMAGGLLRRLAGKASLRVRPKSVGLKAGERALQAEGTAVRRLHGGFACPAREEGLCLQGGPWSLKSRLQISSTGALCLPREHAGG